MKRLKHFLVILCCLFALSQTAEAAVAFVAKGTISTNDASPTSPLTNTSLTVTGAANSALVVYIAASSGGTLTYAATWNGVTVPAVTGTSLYDGASSSQVAMFCLAAPATGAKTLSISWTGTAGEVDYIAVQFSGVNQSTPCTNGTSLTNPASTAAISIPITSANGNMCTAVFNSPDPSMTMNGTSLWSNTAGASINDAGNYLLSTTTTTTLTDNASGNTNLVGAGLNLLAAGGGTPAALASFFSPTAP